MPDSGDAVGNQSDEFVSYTLLSGSKRKRSRQQNQQMNVSKVHDWLQNSCKQLALAAAVGSTHHTPSQSSKQPEWPAERLGQLVQPIVDDHDDDSSVDTTKYILLNRPRKVKDKVIPTRIRRRRIIQLKESKQIRLRSSVRPPNEWLVTSTAEVATPIDTRQTTQPINSRNIASASGALTLNLPTIDSRTRLTNELGIKRARKRKTLRQLNAHKRPDSSPPTSPSSSEAEKDVPNIRRRRRRVARNVFNVLI